MIAYLLKASFILTALLTFYKLFLEKESFFSSNRVYLMAGLLLVFVLPFISLPQLMENQGVLSQAIERVGEYDVDVQTDATASKARVAQPAKGIFFWLVVTYLFGVAVLALNLIFQVTSILLKVLKSSDKLNDSGSIIINSSAFKEPCSFLNFIFINPDNYDFETYEQIIAHEKAHVKHWHSLDLLLSELAVIVLWFNPFIWFYRKEVEKNIEYQTDSLLVETETVKKDTYQLNLLKVATYNRPLTITTNYNQSLLKQRIMKMNSKKSNPFSHWKYAFILPMLFLTLLLVNKPIESFSQGVDTNLGNAISEAESSVKSGIEKIIKNSSGHSGNVVKNKEDYDSDETPEEASEGDENKLPATTDNNCQNLLRAVKRNNLNATQNWLKNTSPNCTYRGDGEPRSPLVAAARNGNFEIGKLLIEHKANVEYHAQGDESPLMAVSRGGSVPLAHLLLEHGADVNKEVRGDGTALIYAVRSGRYEIAELLLEAGADPYQEVPGDEYAMYHARSSGNKKMVELLKKYE